MSKADALRLPEYLRHIIEAIERIHRYVEDVSEVTFLSDQKTQDAVIRNFEIIGEASRNIERQARGFGLGALQQQVAQTVRPEPVEGSLLLVKFKPLILIQ